MDTNDATGEIMRLPRAHFFAICSRTWLEKELD